MAARKDDIFAFPELLKKIVAWKIIKAFLKDSEVHVSDCYIFHFLLKSNLI